MVKDDFLAGRSGIRAKIAAAGKAITYLIVAFIGTLLATAVAKGVFGATLLDLAQGGAVPGTARAILLLLAAVVLPTAVVLTVFKEPFQLSAWAIRGAAGLIAWGLATGFGLLAAIAIVLWLCGAVTFSLAIPNLSAALASLLLSAVLWLAQAAGEEGLNRGYAFVQVCRAISFWPAAILSSAWFMYGHIGNGGETPFGIVATGLLGLALAYSLLKTGSLWFALGFHASWNFAQSFVFGFHNSGGKSPVSLLSANVTGSPLLTGGTAGPEASLLIVPALVVLFAVIQRIARRVVEAPAPGGASRQSITPEA